jgi:glutaminase
MQELGGRIKVYQLQANLTFATAEFVVRDVVQEVGAFDYLIFDLRRVLSINESACRLFHGLLNKFTELKKQIVFTHTEKLPLLRQFMKAKLGPRYEELFRLMDDNDLALEWCENRLLDQASGALEVPSGSKKYELFENFSPEELKQIEPLLTRKTCQPGEIIVRAGEKAIEMFFLSRGSVSVFVPLESGGRKRLATFSPGMVFGEMALIDHAPRSATIIADTQTECDVLHLRDFEELGRSNPDIKIKLLQNLTLILSRRLRKANRELSLFD